MKKRKIGVSYGNNVRIPGIEEIDEDGYKYHLFIDYDNRSGLIYIDKTGVHIEWYIQDGCFSDWVDTNVIPQDMFGNVEKLNHDQLRFICKLLVKNEFDGVTTPKEIINALYQKWLIREKNIKNITEN